MPGRNLCLISFSQESSVQPECILAQGLGQPGPSVSDAQAGWSLDFAWGRKLRFRELPKATEHEGGALGPLSGTTSGRVYWGPAEVPTGAVGGHGCEDRTYDLPTETRERKTR